MRKSDYSIRIINQFANTPDLPGHTRQYELAHGLVKRGWRVIVYSSDFSLSMRSFMRLRPPKVSISENVDGITWKWLWASPYRRNNILRYINMVTFLVHVSVRLVLDLLSDKLSARKSLVLASSPQLPAAFACGLISILFRVPFIFEVRDLWPQILIDQGGMSENSLMVRALRRLELFLYRSASHVIVLSEGCLRYVKSAGGEFVTHIPNGPDLTKFRYSVPPDTGFFEILYAGAHGEANDLSNVIKAAAIMQSWQIVGIRFILIGDGPEKESLKIQASGLSNVTFMDPVPKDIMPRLFAESDAILISLSDVPLFRYGVSPNKLYDAYASGRPVISTISGMINNEIDLLCLGSTSEPNNPLDLVNAILSLASTSHKERTLMGKRARHLAKTKYSRNKAINSLDILISDILEGDTLSRSV